jgi:hypothetical protein
VKSDDDYLRCTVEDTHFQVTFNATGNSQTSNHPYNFTYTGNNMTLSHYVHGQIVSNRWTGVRWELMERIASVRTRITETSLYAALKTNGRLNYTGDTGRSDMGIPDIAISAADKALTRGLGMDELIEELSRNLTFSFFSADRL